MEAAHIIFQIPCCSSDRNDYLIVNQRLIGALYTPKSVKDKRLWVHIDVAFHCVLYRIL